MKNAIIQIRISEIDKEMLKIAAEARQMTMSEYIIDLVRRDRERER